MASRRGQARGSRSIVSSGGARTRDLSGQGGDGHEQSTALIAIDRDIQKLSIARDVKERAKKTQDTAALQFGAQGAIQSGFHELTLGRSDELVIEVASADEQIALVDAKWKTQNEYLESYWTRSNEPGNAHNYAERAQRVYRFLGEDLAEAYAKAVAIRDGVRVIYAKELPNIPPVDPATFIDDFILWIRSTIRWAEWTSQNDVEFDLVIPLTQPWAANGTAIVDPRDMKAMLDKSMTDNGKPVELSFVLTADMFLGSDRPRLRGAGLSYGNRVALITQSGIDKNATADSYVRLRATLTTPEQADANGKTYRRPPLPFGNVSLFGGTAPTAFERGDAITNVNPLGKWSVSVCPNLVYKDDSARDIGHGIEDQPMLDLKLHLRVRSFSNREDSHA